MTIEFNLSEKIEQIDFTDDIDTFVRVRDVKKFIKELKSELWNSREFLGKGTYNEPVTLEYVRINKILDIINKISGDKLI